VLEGELTIRLGPDGKEVVAPAGTLVRVPPHVVHGFRNGSDAEVRYLNLHAPGREFADYLRAMRDGREFSYDQHDPPADGGRPITEVVLERGGPVLADVDAIRVTEGDAVEDPPAPHAHDHFDSFYVLEGALTLTVDGEELTAEAGTWVQIPPGTPHARPHRDGARYLHIQSPA
jgi:quercetin dioxygenase-like cupin family protein